MIRNYKTKNIYESISDIIGKDIIIWGRSVSGLDANIYLTSKGVNVVGYTDTYAKQGERFCNLPVYSVEELKKMQSVIIFVSTDNDYYLKDILKITDSIQAADVYTKKNVYGAGLYDIEKMKRLIAQDEEIIKYVRANLDDRKSVLAFDNLIEYRCTNNDCLLKEIYESDKQQYFEPSLFELGVDEVFIDAGAYNGDTSCVFAKIVGSKYKKIYIMEPDKRLINIVREYVRIKGLHDVEIVEKGAYCKSATITFKNIFESGSSRIDESGDEKIETIAIDEMLDGNYASFIKMDIEGAETEALKGCRKTIEKYHPKLAISIYHLERDLWEIPYVLMTKYPFYSFYIRHYTDITTETVLYAIEKGKNEYV